MITINESGMNFGPFDGNYLYEIEHSDLHNSIGEGVKIAEFVFYENSSKCFWIVEAKSSSPRPQNVEDFSKFIHDIEEKLTNAFLLLNSTILTRHEDSDIPTTFLSTRLKETTYKFFLVIQGHAKEWLPPLQDAMGIALNRYLKTWNIAPNSILVINDSIARNRGIIR